MASADRPVVSVQRVDAYEGRALDQAVAFHFEALEARGLFFPGCRVLLKPNLLAARAPGLAVTTHPAFLAAVARWLRAHGVSRIVLADSPGGVYTVPALRKVYAACGLHSLSELLELNTDAASGVKNGFPLIRPVLEADVVINCAKLKTHGLTVMTAGVKNLFGCVPGLKKPEFHCLRPTSDSFAGLLVDLAETVSPQLTLLDAVDCMEGNGPGGGVVRRMGYTLASRCPHALDAQAARLMGLRPALFPTLRTARARGLLGEAPILMGDPLTPAEPSFTLPDSIIGRERLLTPNGLFHRLCGRRSARPKVLPEKCVGCGRCAESCPRQLIRLVDQKAVITPKGCIACYCCQEMCPARAIEVAGNAYRRKQP